MNEFSRIYDLSLPAVFQGRQKIQATPEECQALAKRFLIVEIQSFDADFMITPGTQDDSFAVDGTIRATLTQSCGVTLTPVQEMIDEPVHIKIRIDQADEDEDFDSEDDVEHLTSTKVDLGELMAQYLSLSLNPFPRAEGAMVEEQGKHTPSGPLADLVKLKKH